MNKQFFKNLIDNLTSSFFWEDGRVMLTACAIISIIFLILLWRLSNGFKLLSWKMWLPVIVCLPIMAFGGIMLRFPNGTGGVTQHFYLGLFMYALCTLIFSGVGEVILILVRKFILR